MVLFPHVGVRSTLSAKTGVIVPARSSQRIWGRHG